jgi:hypothetical protein
MVSTPNAPDGSDGLFGRIEKESEEMCLYKRIFLDYTYGIGKTYTKEEIEKAKQSPPFEREYNLKYLGKIGNVFHTKDIEAAIEKGSKYNPDNWQGKHIAIEKYRSSGSGITFQDVIERFPVKKSQAQRRLKHFHAKSVLFSAQDLICQGIDIVENKIKLTAVFSCLH